MRCDSVVAIDLGSNSFHLLEATLVGGVLAPLNSTRKKVQLALDMDGDRLSSSAMDRAQSCLEMFAPDVKTHSRVRIVGTQALRQANKIDQLKFAELVERILGHPLEIISGNEEAALVFRAVIAEAGMKQATLVVDIGGGSTELAIGDAAGLYNTQSVTVGCVKLLRYFPAAKITQAHFMKAYQFAKRAFDRHAAEFDADGHDVVGSSGTLLAVEQVLIQQGWSEQGISRQALEKLKIQLLSFRTIESVSFQGLTEDRRSVFTSGLAVVMALFDALSIERMLLSQAALREGVALSILEK